jgi:hypothetical protein
MVSYCKGRIWFESICKERAKEKKVRSVESYIRGNFMTNTSSNIDQVIVVAYLIWNVWNECFWGSGICLNIWIEELLYITDLNEIWLKDVHFMLSHKFNVCSTKTLTSHESLLLLNIHGIKKCFKQKLCTVTGFLFYVMYIFREFYYLISLWMPRV